MKPNNTALGPYLAIVAVVAVLAFAGNLAILAQPAQAIPTPTPTVIVVVAVATPQSSIEDQLASLRNQVGDASADLPSFDEFRSALSPDAAPAVDAQPTPVAPTGPTGPMVSSLAVQRTAPGGQPVQYILSTDNAGLRWIGVPGGWLPCTVDRASTDAEYEIWNTLPEWMHGQVLEVCLS